VGMAPRRYHARMLAISVIAALGGSGLAAADSVTGQHAAPAAHAGAYRPAADVQRTTAYSHRPAGGVSRYNVGAPHSPQVLRALSGPLSGTGLRSKPASGSATRSRTSTTGPQMAPATSSTAPACGTTPTTVQGVDVASFQHPTTSQYPDGTPIDWTQVASAGCKFAFIKATEGNYYVNPYYAQDLADAKAAGLYATGYHFANPGAGNGTATSQADYAVSNGDYTKDGQTLPMVLDLEPDPYASQDNTTECYGLSPSAMVSWISAFISEVQSKISETPIIYTTQQWWNACTSSSTAFTSEPLWVAEYQINNPTLPAGWANWAFWQYTSSGTVPGIATSGGTDLSYFQGAPDPQQDTVGTSISPLQIGSLNALAGQTVTYNPTSTLPPGLSMNSSGLITGTVTTPGEYDVSVTATSTSVVPASVSFTWYVHGTVTVTSPGDQSTGVGSPADVQVQASDSVSGQTLTYSATGLPPGTSVSPAGLISGWPTTPGTYNVTVTAADSLEGTGSASFTWTVQPATDSASAGPVRLANGGKCLDDPGYSTANGTRIDIWSCAGSTNEDWAIEPDGSVRVLGKCLDVYHSGTANGTPVDLYSCNGTGAQQWQAGTGGELINPQSGKCLDDPGYQTADGTRTDIWSCAGGTNELWTGPASPMVSGVYGLCADDPGYNTANGTFVNAWSCAGSSNEDWAVEPDGSIRVFGKCLDDPGYQTADGTRIDIWSCAGSSNERWIIRPEGPIGSEVVGSYSGKCLADPQNTAANGTDLVLETCPASPNPETTWHVR